VIPNSAPAGTVNNLVTTSSRDVEIINPTPITRRSICFLVLTLDHDDDQEQVFDHIVAQLITANAKNPTCILCHDKAQPHYWTDCPYIQYNKFNGFISMQLAFSSIPLCKNHNDLKQIVLLVNVSTLSYKNSNPTQRTHLLMKNMIRWIFIQVTSKLSLVQSSLQHITSLQDK
jgi:hypothetical protein